MTYVRKRGSLRAEIVPDGYVLQDGDAIVVPSMFMDAQQRDTPSPLHDGMGNPAGRKQGYVFGGISAEARQRRADAYAAYDRDLTTAWMKPADHQATDQQHPAEANNSSPEEAREKA